MMDIFDLLQNKPQSSIAESASIGVVGVGEAEDQFGIPDGTFSEQEDTGGFDVGTSDAGDEISFDNTEEGEADSNEILNPLADIEDSELSLVTELRISFATLYKDSKIKYDRLITKNLNSSEYGADFKEIQDQYKDVLRNMYLYLKNKYEKESLPTKILQLNTFKIQLNTLHDAANQLLEKIGVLDAVDQD